jgi:asparagine synthase (glutamine-hydrolysing)
MSGVCAIVNFDGAPIDPAVLRAMAEACAYRGPDGIRYRVAGSVGLAYLALHSTPESIRESQPLASADGQISLAADVRIDNRPELMALLTSKGYLNLPDPTDADLVLAAYTCWGPACPEKIIGDYAFVVWDARQQCLFCARDTYGVKSLHYASIGATLVVASEAQQLLKHPQVSCRLDEVAAADYLVGNFNHEGRTMFQDVRALPAANALLATLSGMKIERYWDIDPARRTVYKDDDEYAAHFLEIFRRCVADHLRTQAGTVGITMSGGLDSTSIAAVAHQYLTAQAGRPHLVAISYSFDTLKECDEREYSQAMAKELGIQVVYFPAEKYWLMDNDEAFTPSLETPFMTDQSRNLDVMQIFQQNGARVWLTGHGGDNMLTGSRFVYADRVQRGDLAAFWEVAAYVRVRRLPFFQLMQYYRRWILRPLIPAKVIKAMGKGNSPHLPGWLDADLARRTGMAGRIERSQAPPLFAERARQENYAMAVYPDAIENTVQWSECLAAHFRMEARHPFLDRRLAEYLLSIPPEQIYRVGRSKVVMRNAMQGILPEVVRTRPGKTEFSSYMAIGLRQQETQKIKDLLTSPWLARYHWVKLPELQEFYAEYLAKEWMGDGLMLWRPVSLELWLKQYHSVLIKT